MVKIKKLVKTWLERLGYESEHWTRAYAYRICEDLLVDIRSNELDVLEISPGQHWRHLPFQSYDSVDYPMFDICKEKSSKQYDLIIADQVWEHLPWPYRATKNVYSMLRPGGYFLNLTPFLYKVHHFPVDCSRWTELGMKHLLAECGFDLDAVRTGSWGNRACVKANLNDGYPRRGFFGSLKNESAYPIIVWALARKL